MKPATSLLLGVTIFASVFLESSTTPIKSSTKTVDTLQIPAAKGYIIKTFQNSNALLANTISNTEVALNKVKSEDNKKILTTVLNWLKYLQSLSAKAESTNLASLDKGTVVAIEDAIQVFSKAISDTGAQTDMYVKQLAANPGEVMDCVRTDVKSSLNLILIRAAANRDTMKALLIVQG